MEKKEWKKWMNHLKDDAMKNKKYSQCGEDVVLARIFAEIGTGSGFLVDFGAGDGVSLSNTKMLMEVGWRGLLMDGDNQGNEQVKQEFITAENICSLFHKHGVPQNFDLLSLDIDGNDLWILKAILDGEYRPRVFIVEMNPAIRNGANLTIKYNPTHKWANNDYYGASFEAWKVLGKEYGYTLICQIESLNMIFVKSDIIPQDDYEIDYKQKRDHAPSPANSEWVKYIPTRVNNT
jgi:hypothetical protein